MKFLTVLLSLVISTISFSKDYEKEKKSLTKMQYYVTQEDGTEPAFENKYWNNKKEGIYVDVVSGEPLFSSTDKFKSGTGWPSFTKPIDGTSIVEKSDYKFFIKRTELRSKKLTRILVTFLRMVLNQQVFVIVLILLHLGLYQKRT